MAEWIDPKTVPQRTLYTGDTMPAIGMGTFGSDRFTSEEISNAVAGAPVSYTHLDVYKRQGYMRPCGGRWIWS